MTKGSRTIFVALGLWLASLHVSSPGNAAPANGGETPKVVKGTTSTRVPGLAVWVEPTVPEGERIGGWVEERGAEVLRQHEPPLEPQDLVRVAVRGGPYDYQLYVALLRNRRLLPNQPGVLVCECGSDEMLDRVGEAIAAGARRLTDSAAAEREVADEAREKTEPQVAADTTRKRRRLGALGYAGIGVGVLGAGLLGAGIPLALREEEIRGGPGQIETRSMRGLGSGLAAGGGVALAAGVSLLVVDLIRQRKRMVAVAPILSAWQVGVAIAWQASGRGRR
jgi:hypothetical protein